MYQHHHQMTHTHLTIIQWLNSIEGLQITRQLLFASRDTFENSFFLKRCFIMSLVICSNDWFTQYHTLQKINPLNNVRCLSPIINPWSNMFQKLLAILNLKILIIPASQGYDWEVVFLGKNTSLMFLRFPWTVLGWDGALCRNNKTFQFFTSSLRSKTVRNWIMVFVVIHAFLLLKYCIPYDLEGLCNFQNHHGTVPFPITPGLNTLNPLEDTKNCSKLLFDLLLPLRFLFVFTNPVSGGAFKESPGSSIFQMSLGD